MVSVSGIGFTGGGIHIMNDQGRRKNIFVLGYDERHGVDILRLAIAGVSGGAVQFAPIFYLELVRQRYFWNAEKRPLPEAYT